jgi:hypothetical protein
MINGRTGDNLIRYKILIEEFRAAGGMVSNHKQLNGNRLPGLKRLFPRENPDMNDEVVRIL